MSDRVPFSDLVEINPRTVVRGNNPPFIGMQDVSEGGRIVNIRRRPRRELSGGLSGFRDGDVLFAKITPCMENGKGAYVENVGDSGAFGSTEFHVLRAKNSADSRFIYHWTQAQALRRAAEAMMTGSAGQRRVPSHFFHRFRVPAFSVIEQRRIAEILDALDDRASSIEKQMDKVEVRNAAIVSKWMGESDVPPIPLASYLSGRPKNGFSPKEVDGWTGIKALGLGCLTPRGFQPVQLKNVPAEHARNDAAMLADGDLLMSRANTRELVGLAGVYRDIGAPCIYPDLMMRIRCNSACLPEFLELLLRGSGVRRQIQAHAQGTSESMVKISSSIVLGLRVRIPRRDVQEQILRRVEVLQGEVERLRTERLKVLSVRAGLAEDLLTGRVRV